jgi:thioesterase domain-containing protein/acyl carrier protein
MPRTPNGKVDRTSLPAVGSSQVARETEHVSPRDEVERALVDIWERELGVKPIGVEENFFELGGHSLLAVRVFAQLKRTLGVELPLAAFLRAPTITQLAELIREDEPQTASSWKSLVEIEPGGTKPPLFCVHAHGGHVLFYKDLARHLGSERPFYALQAQGVDGTLAPLTRFEEMAANYVREIRSVQPRGPYHLGGDCLGGVLAYEMAQQLRAGGDEVAIVAMFDSFHPRYRPYLPQPLYELIHQTRLLFGFNLVNLARLPWREKVVYVRARVQHAAYRARYLRWALQRHLARRKEPSGDPLIRTQTALDDAFDAYEPRCYEGHVALFRATRQPAGIRKDPALGWSGLIPELDVYAIPAYFTTGVYEPAVATLAAELRRCLDGVDGDDDSDGRQLGRATQGDRSGRLRRFRRRPEMTRT